MLNRVLRVLAMCSAVWLAACGTTDDRYGGSTVEENLRRAIVNQDDKSALRFAQKIDQDPNTTRIAMWSLSGYTRPLLAAAVQEDLYLTVQHVLNTAKPAPTTSVLNEALMVAVMYDRQAFANQLIQKGVSTSIQTYNGDTLLHLAVSKPMVDLLLSKGASVDARNAAGDTPLLAMLRRAAEARIPPKAYVVGESQHAAPYPTVPALQTLIDRGAAANVRNNKGETPIEVAKKYPEYVALLARQGVDVKIRDDEGMTPLLRAAEAGDMELTKLLLSKGAGVRDAYLGKTALHLAEIKGYAQVSAVLIAAGADPNARDHLGDTPKQAAARAAQIAAAKRQQEERAEQARLAEQAKQDRQRWEAQERARQNAPSSPSIWEMNAEASARALRDMQSADSARRARDARSQSGCSGGDTRAQCR